MVVVIKKISYALAFIAFVVLIIYAFNAAPKSQTIVVELNNNATTTEEKSLIESDLNPFNKYVFEARAIHVYNTKTKETLFERNADASMPLASLTKLMTALLANDLAPSNSLVLITDEALSSDGDNGLHSLEKFKLKDLTNFMLVSSSNDSARAIAYTVGLLYIDSSSSVDNLDRFEFARLEFIERMNKKAREIGLSSTQFYNESGLDDLTTNTPGAVGSARNVSKLLSYILEKKPPLLDVTTQKELVILSEDGVEHKSTNTNIVTEEIPNLVASKTGFTDLAGGNLAIAFKTIRDEIIIVTVLSSSYDGRFTDVKNLVKASIDYLQEKDVISIE